MRRAMRGEGLLIALLVALALGLRLNGIEHGYPDYVSGDERLLVKEAVRFFDEDTLEPGHYNYPALYSYLYAGALGLCRWLGGLDSVGGLQVPMGFAVTFNMVLFALVGRWLSALAGAALVGVVYWLGRRAYGSRAGLGGALLAACSPLLVGYGRLALPEATLALLATGACCAWVDIARGGGRRGYVLGGLLAGLAISTKYNGGMVLGGLLAAHMLRLRQEGWGSGRAHADLPLAGACVVLAFLLGSPYWLFSFERYFQALLDVHSNAQFSLGAQGWPWVDMLASLLSGEGMVGALGVAGCAWALWRRRAADAVLLAVLVPSFLYIGSWPKTGLHYLIFAAPLAGLLASRWLLECRPLRAWGPTLLVVVALPVIWQQVEQGRALGREDVRVQAARWIEANVGGGSTIGGYWLSYLPPLKGLRQQEKLQELMAVNQGDPQAVESLRRLAQQNRFYRCVRLHFYANEPQVPEPYLQSVDLRDPKTLRIFRHVWLDYEEIRNLGVDYVLLSSAAYGRFFGSESPPEGTAAHYFHTRSRDFVTQFFDGERFEVVRHFEDDSGTRISLLRVRPQPVLVSGTARGNALRVSALEQSGGLTEDGDAL